MKIAILTRPDNRSPKILADSLKLQLEQVGVKADIFHDINVLKRLKSYNELRGSFKFHFWLRRKIFNFFLDRRIINQLKLYDAIIISECSPNAFWSNLYHIEKLREILKKPILLYEVYYLGNAPTQLDKLIKAGDASIERYDWHLSVTNITEIRSMGNAPCSCIGLDLTNSILGPVIKDEFIAVVDFKQEGYEKYHLEQIKALSELKIKTIILDGSYSLSEIREIYRKASVFFIQFPEAYGLPIAECLACGVQIFTPNLSWPMSWRLDENPQIHAEGILPDVFTIYKDEEELRAKLTDIRDNFDLQITPFQIFNSFIKHYPHYYYGDKNQLRSVINRIKDNRFE